MTFERFAPIPGIGSSRVARGHIHSSQEKTQRKNRRMEPSETPSCLILCLLIVFTQQLQILVTTLNQFFQITITLYYIRLIDYMDRRDTPPELVNSPTQGSPPPSKQTLCHYHLVISVSMKFYYYQISLLHHVCNQHEWADGHCDH